MMDKRAMMEIARKSGRQPAMMVVPTVHDLRAGIKEVKPQPKPERAEELTMAEMLAGLKDGVKSLYPTGSVLMLGIVPLNDETTSVVYEYAGTDEALWSAMAESMHHSDHAVKLIERALAIYMTSADNEKAERAVTALQDLIQLMRKRNSRESRIKLLEPCLQRVSRRFGQTIRRITIYP